MTESDRSRSPDQEPHAPTEARPPLAGVSGFGWSGTNAHVVLEGYASPGGAVPGPDGDGWIAGAPRPIAASLPASVAPPRSEDALASRETRLLPLSGKSGAALRDVAVPPPAREASPPDIQVR